MYNNLPALTNSILWDNGFWQQTILSSTLKR